MTRGLVIGGGAVGVDFHLPRMLGILSMDEVCVVDNSAQRRAQLEARYSNNSQISIFEKIPQGKFDVSVIATPPKYHLEVFGQLLECSSKIIVEKPMTKTLSEAKLLLEQAKERDERVYVAHIRRSLGSFSWMKDCYREQAFGNLNSVRLYEGSIFGWNAVSIGSFSKDLNGGGVLMDTGPHAIDQLYQIFDHLSLSSSKMDAVPRLSNTAIEANVHLELIADGKVPVTLALSRNRVFSNQLIFEYDNVNVCLGLHNNLVTLKIKSGAELVGTPEFLQQPVTYVELFDAFYKKYVAEGDNSGVSPMDAIKSQEILESAYEKAGAMAGGF